MASFSTVVSFDHDFAGPHLITTSTILTTGCPFCKWTPNTSNWTGLFITFSGLSQFFRTLFSSIPGGLSYNLGSRLFTFFSFRFCTCLTTRSPFGKGAQLAINFARLFVAVLGFCCISTTCHASKCRLLFDRSYPRLCSSTAYFSTVAPFPKFIPQTINCAGVRITYSFFCGITRAWFSSKFSYFENRTRT